MIGLIVACVACAALGAVGILIVLGAGKLGRSSGDDMAIADATREPRITSQDIEEST